jgi:hypothetical protein
MHGVEPGSHEADAGCGCRVDHTNLARVAVEKALAELLPQAAKEAVDGALSAVVERAVTSALGSLIAQFNAVTGSSIGAPPAGNSSQPPNSIEEREA